jgi:hypothetical protein
MKVMHPLVVAATYIRSWPGPGVLAFELAPPRELVDHYANFAFLQHRLDLRFG